jgi:hypothetical protein
VRRGKFISPFTIVDCSAIYWDDDDDVMLAYMNI